MGKLMKYGRFIPLIHIHCTCSYYSNINSQNMIIKIYIFNLQRSTNQNKHEKRAITIIHVLINGTRKRFFVLSLETL